MYTYPCIHRGKELGTFNCGCGIGDQPVFQCLNQVLAKGKCVIRLGNAKFKPAGKDLLSCSDCDFSERPPLPPPVPTRIKPIPLADPPKERRPKPGDIYRRSQLEKINQLNEEAKKVPRDTAIPLTNTHLLKVFDEHSLCPGQFGKRFNCSILPWQDGFLFAFRDGWSGSQVHLIRLNRLLEPEGASWRLNLFHKIEANYGREDPRLFMHQGKVHVAYSGVSGGTSIAHTSVLYARLGDDLQVEELFYPHLPERNPWEKNWACFSSGDNLYAIYSIAPHRIVELSGNRAEFAFTTPTAVRWPGGEMRGGASPVLHNGEWYHFFHDRVSINGLLVYRTGVYTFEAEAPFRIKRFCSKPILAAETHNIPQGQYAAVTFVGGAVVHDDHWLLASGIHDRYSALHCFPMEEIEGLLRPVA
jgi:predicted GH43/DUF377 family glycosyl hydrolase